MSKHNRSAKVRARRRWLLNVGDGQRLSRDNNNPNDKPRQSEK